MIQNNNDLNCPQKNIANVSKISNSNQLRYGLSNKSTNSRNISQQIEYCFDEPCIYVVPRHHLDAQVCLCCAWASVWFWHREGCLGQVVAYQHVIPRQTKSDAGLGSAWPTYSVKPPIYLEIHIHKWCYLAKKGGWGATLISAQTVYPCFFTV